MMRRLYIFFILILLCVGCSVDKYIPTGEFLLNKNIYVVEQDALTENEYKVVSSALSSASDYAQQLPNSRILGVRLGMRIYCLSNPDKDNWLNNTIRKQGAAPVIFDRSSVYATAQQLKLLSEIKGCFNTTVSYQTDTIKDNKVNVVYRIFATPRYMIDSLSLDVDNENVRQLVEQNAKRTLIKKGDYYDQNIFSAERDRVISLLQNSGYYNVTKDIISFVLDTNQTDYTMDVIMRITNPKVYNADDKVVEEPLQKYYFDNIYIYPDLMSLLPITSYKKMDTIRYIYSNRGRETVYNFVTNKKMTLNESVISRAIFLEPGRLYRQRSVELTYNSLINLRNFKFTDIEFSRSDKQSDTAGFLNARIRLMNAMRHSISTSFEITNTSPLWADVEETNNIGNFGLQWTMGYQNKNLFGGAELFNVKTSLLFELAKSALKTKAENFYDIFSAFETGIDMSLDIPKFIVPMPASWFAKGFRPHTILSLGFNYQFRTYFERALANTSFGYNWRNRLSRQHQFIPFEFTYVRFLNQTEEFQQQIDALSDLRLKYQYSDHLITNTHYTFVYNTQQFNTKNNFTYFSLNLEAAGNLLYLLDRSLDMPVDSAGIYRLLGVPYSQYVRTEIDWKHYFYLANNNTFVARVMFGIGVPYGNSMSLPYEKSFYGGGPTTIRAWNIRTLGPGSYFNESTNVFERVGDMSLVINLEDRFHLFGIFEGAAFIDMGNIWLLRPSDEFPDGNFTFKTFIPELAIGGGLGLRMNISIITLRLDFAIPFYDPQYAKSERWRFPHWKWNQIVTNFGIDYPF